MPAQYERSFRVRHYECEPTGALNQAVYLRYMQESAYEASAAGGYGMVSYSRAGTAWFVRETEIEYLTPAVYGQRVVVRTWVEDFHRVRSIRAYELYTENPDRLAARAWSDWVYLDRSTRQPRSIPVEMIQAFYPEWEPKLSRPRRKFPAPASPAPVVFQDDRRVEWRDLDPAGHVNNAVYYTYLDECWRKAGSAFGWPRPRLDELHLAIHTRRAQLAYLIPANLGDELRISTWISDLQTTSWTRHFMIKDLQDGSLVMQAQMLQVWLDQRSGQPVRIPVEVLDSHAPNISGGENGISDTKV